MGRSPKSTGKGTPSPSPARKARNKEVTPSPASQVGKALRSTGKMQYDWICFRRAKPEQLPKLTPWMVDTWGKVEPDNRRGFHFTKLKEMWRAEFMEIYKLIYRTNTVYNNEVGTVLARAFAAFKHGVKVDWDDFARRRDQKAHYNPVVGSNRKELELDFCRDSDSVRSSTAHKHARRLSTEAKLILSSWHDSLSARSADLLANLQHADVKVRESQKEVDSFEGTRTWLSNKIASMLECGDGQNVMKEAFEKDMLDVEHDLETAEDCLRHVQAQRQDVNADLERMRLYGVNLDAMVLSLSQTGVHAMVPQPTAHPIVSKECFKLRICM